MAANEIKFTEKLVHCLCGVGVRIVSNSSEAMDAFFEEMQESVKSPEYTEALRKRLKSIKPGRLYEIQSPLGILLALAGDGDKTRFMMVGPCVTQRLTDKKLREQMERYKLRQKQADRIQEHYRSLPEIGYDTFHELASLLAARYLAIAEPVPYERIEYKDDSDLRRQLVLSENYDELSKMRHIERRYEYSTAMTEAVKAGNLTLAYSFLRQMRPASNEIVRNPNPLRNAQNLCIVANTQLRHAMEESGIHPYTLDKVSGEIALRIEKLRSQKEAYNFSTEIIRRYCELAREPKVSHLKPFSRLAVTYIMEHLTDNLTVKTAAQALVVNPNYLSSQFHKEVGMKFSQYVNTERVRQAASLLLHTQLPIEHIATSVGYNNSSYFAKQFARVYGMGPRVYRNSRGRIPEES